jgi:hypothetical protein
MDINPTESLVVVLKTEVSEIAGCLVTLTDESLSLKSQHFLQGGGGLSFRSRFFRGHAGIKNITFDKDGFVYELEILTIQFQPGLLINVRL